MPSSQIRRVRTSQLPPPFLKDYAKSDVLLCSSKIREPSSVGYPGFINAIDGDNRYGILTQDRCSIVTEPKVTVAPRCR
jgi:hypothetical protein